MPLQKLDRLSQKKIDANTGLGKLNSFFASRENVLEYYEQGIIEGNGKWGDTIELTTQVKNLKAIRMPFYLKKDELDRILLWKLRQQYGRQKYIRDVNTDHNIQEITKAAFTVYHDNFEVETQLKVELLTTIPGVEIPVASAILTVCYPDKYAIIDSRNWKRLFAETSKGYYTIREYLLYLNIVKRAAQHFSVTMQQLDIAIWALG